MPVKTEKEKDFKPPPSGVDHQLPQGLILPPGTLITSIGTQPSIQLPPKPPNVEDVTTSPNLGQEQNVDFEKNSSNQEGFITEMYVAPDQSYLDQPQELTKLINTSKVVQRYHLQQADIDKILDIIKRKVLKGTHLPLTIKEIQTGYLTSPFFKDLYRYLAQNIMPHKRHARHKVEALAE